MLYLGEADLELELLEQDDAFQQRFEQIDTAGVFGEVYRQGGETFSYAALAPAALAAQEQLELDLPGYSQRAATRLLLADKIEREVLPIFAPKWLDAVPTKLRTARQSGPWGIRLNDGKLICYWDNKAGLSRLCPDDAREEAMRLRRRVQPPLEALQADGHQLTYAVLTMPNSAPGELAKGMRAIFRRFRALLKAKDADGALLFPQIKGSLCVLEAPLGQSRDWHVHLNVIFVTQGFFDWKALRARWHWQLHLQKLTSSPGAIGAALTELIKYAVSATVSKSADHARRGESHAPPMLEWKPAELVEWLQAMHGFRRTRSYGALYGLKKPEPEEVGPIAWLGRVSLQGGRYVHSCPLLGSIPEDKSTPGGYRSAWEKYIQRLWPPGPSGLQGLEHKLPRFAELT